LVGLRISEVFTQTMGQFFCQRDTDGHKRWWLAVIDKGGNELRAPEDRQKRQRAADARRSAKTATNYWRPHPARGWSNWTPIGTWHARPVLRAPHEAMPQVLPLGQSTKPLTRAHATRRCVSGVYTDVND
jgi:hypothetical protein